MGWGLVGWCGVGGFGVRFGVGVGVWVGKGRVGKGKVG